MDQLVGFLLHPHFLKLAKKIGKMSKYTPHFQSAFGTAAYTLTYTQTHTLTYTAACRASIRLPILDLLFLSTFISGLIYV